MACIDSAQRAGSDPALPPHYIRLLGGQTDRTVAHDEPVYDAARIAALREMLRSLAQRIDELDRSDRLLANVPELLRRLGDLRSELFHYEVRSTYDSPEVAEHRRLVDEARTPPDFLSEGPPEPEDDEPWRRRPPE